MENQEFKLTYYVSAMLAQGGTLRVMDDKIVFSPGTIERAVGASDTEIPYHLIKLVDVTGTITESLFIRTQEKAYRFVGGEPYKVRDIIHSAVQNYMQNRTGSMKVTPQTQDTASAQHAAPQAVQPKAEQSHPGAACPTCQKPVRSDYNFCPHCKKALRKICMNCNEPEDPNWKYCAVCGAEA